MPQRDTSLVSGQLFGSSSHDYGYFSSKVGEHFEYTDKVAGIGYCHQIYRAFTAQMLLLERAEAEVMLGKYADASNDLRWYWNCQLNTFSEDDKKQFVSTGYNKYMSNSEFTNYYAKATNTNCYSGWDFMNCDCAAMSPPIGKIIAEIQPIIFVLC